MEAHVYIMKTYLYKYQSFFAGKFSFLMMKISVHLQSLLRIFTGCICDSQRAQSFFLWTTETDQTSDMCTKRRFRSESSQVAFVIAKGAKFLLIDNEDCAGLYESSLGTYIRRYISLVAAQLFRFSSQKYAFIILTPLNPT